MNTYEIPLSGKPQTLNVAIGPSTYQLAFKYMNVTDGGWIMDISDAVGTPLVCGIPLVTGADLLAQYRYLGIQGSIVVATDGDADAVPTFESLGTTSHVYVVTP